MGRKLILFFCVPALRFENKIIDDILELLNKNGLTSHQSQNLPSFPDSYGEIAMVTAI